MTTLAHRHEFVVLFDVSKGNPNGDPDAGNMPRLDPETNRGLVSDVSLKRKIRNYIQLAKNENTPDIDKPLSELGKRYEIFVTERAILDIKQKRAWDANAIKPDPKDGYKKLPKEEAQARILGDWMCANFFDVRTFGAVMSTSGANCGQIRGPVQFAFAESVEAIVPQEISITRMAATKDDDTKGDNRTMGRKHIVPYGLYRAHGFISAKLAERTGFSEADLEILLEAVENMFEHDRSAARGEMAVRKLIVFKHATALGNAPAHRLFERVTVGRNIEGAFKEIGDRSYDNYPPARSFKDYIVQIDTADLPDGVTLDDRL
jgi:CRISPR-associated protein Csd2